MKFKEFIFESKNLKVQTAVSGFGEGFIDTLIDKLSFLYKTSPNVYFPYFFIILNLKLSSKQRWSVLQFHPVVTGVLQLTP
jgi:hypothetical protein